MVPETLLLAAAGLHHVTSEPYIQQGFYSTIHQLHLWVDPVWNMLPMFLFFCFFIISSKTRSSRLSNPLLTVQHRARCGCHWEVFLAVSVTHSAEDTTSSEIHSLATSTGLILSLSVRPFSLSCTLFTNLFLLLLLFSSIFKSCLSHFPLFGLCLAYSRYLSVSLCASALFSFLFPSTALTSATCLHCTVYLSLP